MASMKLKHLRQGPSEPLQRVKTVDGTPTRRMTGRRLQGRRIRLWTKSPHCAICRRLTNYPHGFELDHITRLDEGGADVESNCQILCVWYDILGIKQGCHIDKTAAETIKKYRGY